jgi:hypothetical protein
MPSCDAPEAPGSTLWQANRDSAEIDQHINDFYLGSDPTNATLYTSNAIGMGLGISTMFDSPSLFGQTCFVAGTRVLVADVQAVMASRHIFDKQFLTEASLVVAALAPIGYFVYSLVERKRFLAQAAGELELIEPFEMPLRHGGMRKMPAFPRWLSMACFCDKTIFVAI